ncbi:MAG: phosphatase PAP2/dual specificity phosphatase family protein, partial [Chthoniobacterales bacterium]
AALCVSAGLSALFLVVYGATNWIASQRADVGSIAFVWERHLPFVPIFIAPYLSIDLFFVAAPFLCRSSRELATLAKRIAAAILAAGVCFLLIPFRFAFARPQTDGWLGAVFDWFRGMDAPFNLFPSLHITLVALLGVVYARHTRGALRVALVIWFGLIAASAVLTFQHHFLDVVGGFALAGYCFYFIREDRPPSLVRVEKRIGFYYAIGAVFTLILAVGFWPWGALLLWPATSLAIAASGYFGFGPGIFRKTDGRLPWSTLWALGPVLVGQHLSRIYYRRQCRAWDAVTPRVWIGSALREREAREAARAGVTSVLDLTAEFSAPPAFRKLVYLNLPILDLTAPNLAHLEEMAHFISREAERGVVYVHCKIGYSRSAAAVAAYLLQSGCASSAAESIGQLRAARPAIVVRPEVRRALVEFEQNIRRDFVLASNEPSPF